MFQEELAPRSTRSQVYWRNYQRSRLAAKNPLNIPTPQKPPKGHLLIKKLRRTPTNFTPRFNKREIPVLHSTAPNSNQGPRKARSSIYQPYLLAIFRQGNNLHCKNITIGPKKQSQLQKGPRQASSQGFLEICRRPPSPKPQTPNSTQN